MSKKASPTSIGLFVVIGVALGVAGVIIFSSGRLFAKTEKFILYFDSSLKGLDPGAPVKFRGVTIGSVLEVLIAHDQLATDYSMPVIIEIDEKLLQEKSDRKANLASQERLDRMVRVGLRGKLDASSLVTGLLYVQLEVVRDAPPPVYHQLTKEYREIPTAPTQIQELLSHLAHVDIRGIFDKLNALLSRLDTSLGEFNVRDINSGVTNLLASADRVVAAPDLTNSFVALRTALDDAGRLLRKIDERVDPLADSATNTLADLRRTLQDVSGALAPEGPLRVDLTMTLDQFADAARAIADLAEFLQRHPNAILAGRKSGPTKAKP
jgi:paraquat-inducible protein B